MKRDKDIDRIKIFFQKDANTLFRKYKSASNKYNKIWNIYEDRMPNCIRECKNTFGGDIAGPQGVYWIGNKVKLLFVGLENYGWNKATYFKKNKEEILYNPLKFAFNTVSSMPSYWGIIKYIIYETIGEKGWEDILDYVAFTNRCKCYSSEIKIKSQLHKNCFEQQYIIDEIAIINSPINILFTASRGRSIIDHIESGEPMAFKLKRVNIYKRNVNGKIFYELYHPTRMSYKVIEQLIKSIKEDILEKEIEIN